MINLDVLNKITTCLSDKKADNIVAYDMDGFSALTSCILVVTAKNTIHAKSLFEELNHYYRTHLKHSEDFDPLRLSGNADSGWVVVDMNDILIHIILSDLREFYALDEVYKGRSQLVTHHS